MDTAAPPPRVLATGIGSGLLLMAVFTMWWASDTFTGWPTPVAASVSAVCGLGAIVFVAHAVRLLLAGRRMRTAPTAPTAPTASDRARKSDGALFGVVFGAEGVLIAIAVVVLGATGLQRFLVPTIAVIVGLHFYPMARVFRRRIDVGIATWTTLVGTAGVIAVLADGAAWPLVWSWVGAGAAVATLAYGIHMTRAARRLLRATAGAD